MLRVGKNQTLERSLVRRHRLQEEKGILYRHRGVVGRVVHEDGWGRGRDVLLGRHELDQLGRRVLAKEVGPRAFVRVGRIHGDDRVCQNTEVDLTLYFRVRDRDGSEMSARRVSPDTELLHLIQAPDVFHGPDRLVLGSRVKRCRRRGGRRVVKDPSVVAALVEVQCRIGALTLEGNVVVPAAGDDEHANASAVALLCGVEGELRGVETVTPTR